MNFDLTTIAVFILFALMYLSVLPKSWRAWALMLVSVVAIYWLQPRLNIRFADFILPTATLTLTVISWWFTRKPDDDEQQSTRAQDRVAFALIVALVIGLSLMRFVDADFRLTASRPPEPFMVVLVLAVIFALVWLLNVITGKSQRRILNALIVLIVGVFIVLKWEPLAVALSGAWRGATAQDTSLASMIDLNWLGFSYVAFRLIHTYRDRQQGLLPALSLREYVTYVVFFPAFIAGPIDRAERFITDFRTLPELVGFDASRWMNAGGRISMGVFKKFVIADTLAQGLSLTTLTASETNSTLGMWALAYGYAFRLFFDFSGYTDIAIGIGILFGITLPENFKAPYLTTNITAFWQSWHITLSNWVRFYWFSPVSRALLKRKPKPSPTLIVFITQTTTMLIIGLWHGVTLNFLIWGAWHGVALFIHKQWSDRTRKWYRTMSNEKPTQFRLWTLATWFLTFHFVVLGWVWFALPDVALSLRVFGVMFGFGGVIL